VVLGVIRRSSVVDEQHVAGIVLGRGHQEHALTSLRQPEGPCVDDAVSPAIAKIFQAPDDDLHRPACVQLEHKRHILEQDVPNPSLAQETEDFANEPRSGTVDTGSASSLREILAGKASHYEIDTDWQAVEGSNVFVEAHAWEAGSQHLAGQRIDLTQQLGAMARCA
jgi:hypothetical protein